MTLSAIALLAAAVAIGAEQPASGPGGQRAARAASAPAAARPLLDDIEPYVETRQAGRIDWTSGQLVTQGTGKARGSSGNAVSDARLAARQEAARRASTIMEDIPLDPDGGKADMHTVGPRIERAAGNLKESAIEYDPVGGTVSVTFRAPLYGPEGLINGFQPAPRASRRWSPPALPGAADQNRQVQTVVIDARATKFRPVVFPSIESPRGETVFDAGDLPKGQLSRRPMVTYAKLRPQAGKLDRQAAEQPGMVLLKPSSTKGKADGSLVLSEDDLRKLADNPDARRVMQEGKAVVLLAPPGPAAEKGQGAEGKNDQR